MFTNLHLCEQARWPSHALYHAWCDSKLIWFSYMRLILCFCHIIGTLREKYLRETLGRNTFWECKTLWFPKAGDLQKNTCNPAWCRLTCICSMLCTINRLKLSIETHWRPAGVHRDFLNISWSPWQCTKVKWGLERQKAHCHHADVACASPCL